MKMRNSTTSTSSPAPIRSLFCMNMASPVVTDLKMLEKRMVTYDACLSTILLAPTIPILSDNPRHSELLNHAGGSANKYCRMCMVRSIVNIQSDCQFTLLNPQGKRVLTIGSKANPPFGDGLHTGS